MDYESIETGVLTHFRTYFSDYIDNPEQVVASDLDAFVGGVIGEGKDYGILIDMGGGRRPTNEKFKSATWEWRFLGIFTIRYVGNTETQDRVRPVYIDLARVFLSDHTVGGVSPRIRIEAIEAPQIMQIGDVPFYWIGFEFTALDTQTPS